jgi:hypothetical protein
MEIRKGDRVKFLNESGGGVVTKLIDNNNAIVLIDDGFEIPVPTSQLISTESSTNRQQGKNSEFLGPRAKIVSDIPGEHSYEKKIKEFKEIAKPLFAIVPELISTASEEKIYKFYLLNNGDYNFCYLTSFEKDGRLKLLEKGDLEPETVVYLGTFNLKEILAFQVLNIDILFYSETEYHPILPVHYKVNFNTINFSLSSNFIENDFFDNAAYVIDLLVISSNIKSNVQTKKMSIVESSIAKSDKKNALINNDIEEVDLHIEEIVENEKELSNGEILNIQMARFETKLEGAIIEKSKKIIFIHGVGNGKLRYELRKTLDTKYPDIQYQDASFAEYGYGATMVILKK